MAKYQPMLKVYMLATIFGVAFFYPLNARAVCRDAVVKGIPVEICASSNEASAKFAGQTVASAKSVSNPPAWEIQFPIPILNSVLATRGRFQINSGGPYQDRLILELCAKNPVWIKFSGAQVTVGKDKCSQWYDLGPFPYVGP